MAIVGIVLVVVGVAAGKTLAMAGLGQTKPERSPTSTEDRPRGSIRRIPQLADSLVR